ncbi:MAG: XkdX family protein [Lactobacillus kalixensis]|uniref:XkdX family protein n=1 Tax=Lactobacillus kalixensis TaxID=227944 RepID=UPI003994E7F7
MLNFDLDMTSIYQMQYQFGFTTKDKLRSAVAAGYLTAQGYAEIVGDDQAKQGDENEQTSPNDQTSLA